MIPTTFLCSDVKKIWWLWPFFTVLFTLFRRRVLHSDIWTGQHFKIIIFLFFPLLNKSLWQNISYLIKHLSYFLTKQPPSYYPFNAFLFDDKKKYLTRVFLFLNNTTEVQFIATVILMNSIGHKLTIVTLWFFSKENDFKKNIFKSLYLSTTRVSKSTITNYIHPIV